MEFLVPRNKKGVAASTISLSASSCCGHPGKESRSAQLYVAYHDGTIAEYSLPGTIDRQQKAGEDSVEGSNNGNEEMNSAKPTHEKRMMPVPSIMKIVKPAFPTPPASTDDDDEHNHSSPTTTTTSTSSTAAATVPPALLCQLSNGFRLHCINDSHQLDLLASFSLDGYAEEGGGASKDPMVDFCWLQPDVAVATQGQSGTLHLVSNLLIYPEEEKKQRKEEAQEETEKNGHHKADGDVTQEAAHEEKVSEEEVAAVTEDGQTTPDDHQKEKVKKTIEAAVKHSIVRAPFTPVISVIPQTATTAWVVGSRQMALLDVITEELSCLQTIDLPEEVAAVSSFTTAADQPTMVENNHNSGGCLWVASESLISLVKPWNGSNEREEEQEQAHQDENHRSSLRSTSVLGTLASEEPLSAVFTRSNFEGTSKSCFVVTNSGTIVEVLCTTPNSQANNGEGEEGNSDGDGTQLAFGDDFGIEALDQEDAALMPYRVDLIEGGSSSSFLFFLLTAPQAITIAANKDTGAAATKADDDDSKDSAATAPNSTQEEAQTGEDEASREAKPKFVGFEHEGGRLLIAGELQEQIDQIPQQNSSSSASVGGVVMKYPQPRNAITVGLDTADLEDLRHEMDDVVRVRMIGESNNNNNNQQQQDGEEFSSYGGGGHASGSGSDPQVRFVSIPHGCTLSVVRDRLETLFDRRLVISFPSATSVTSSGQRKLIELRPSTLKIFHAIAPEDKALVCRPLYPQVSRARSSTPGNVSRSQLQSPGSTFGGDLTGLTSRGEFQSQQRSRTVLGKDEEGAMLDRLYNGTQRDRAIKLLQLEEKFLPRAQPVKLGSSKAEGSLIERLTEGDKKKKEQSRTRIVKQFEKEGYIRPKEDKRPDHEEQDAIIQKFYYEALKKEKAREDKLNKKLFKSERNPPKLKNPEEWKEWEDKRKKGIKQNFRLKDQYY